MKIGIFTDRYLPQTDGICYSVETYRIELEKLGHEVYVFAPKPSWRYKERSSRIIRFASVKGLFWEDYLMTFYFPPQAIKQIEKLNLDIIHYQTPGQIGLLGAYYAIRHHIPLVTTYHTDLFEYVKHYPSVLPGTIALSLLAPVITGGGMEEYRNALSSIKPERSVDKWNQKIVVRGLTLLHNHCDLVITPSLKMEKQLRSWKTTSRLATLPTGVDKITTTKREIAHIRKKYDLQKDDQIILSVSRIGTEKNLGLIIESFDIIGARNPNAKLVFIGYGDDLELFKQQAAKSPYADRIQFTGQIDHQKLGAFYSIGSVYGCAALTDTQGMTLNEAACAGMPIVMIDKQVSEVIVNGENGYFSRNTAKDFAAKILQVLSNPKLHARMSKRSIELGAQVSASKQAAKLLRLYEETIRDYEPPKPQLKSFFKQR
ncbi:MAG: hypothetical protein JWN01_912 [Patescibacteria group bacterium]|nr:hypothetical protein [Patescibacteria group bacterium]